MLTSEWKSRGSLFYECLLILVIILIVDYLISNTLYIDLKQDESTRLVNYGFIVDHISIFIRLTIFPFGLFLLLNERYFIIWIAIAVALVYIKLFLSICVLIFLLLNGIALASHLFLLWDVFVLWISNTWTFTLWYWMLDGNFIKRINNEANIDKSKHFVFPQHQLDNRPDFDKYTPKLIDYLFLSFNTSTAFSPTDTIILSSWSKVFVMLQSATSLFVLLSLLAHAINIVGPLKK